MAGEVEGDEAELGAAAFGIDGDDVLMLFGAGLELELAGALVIGGDVVVVVIAGEAFGGAGGADGPVCWRTR